MNEPSFSIGISIFVAFSWGINAHLIKKGMIGEHPLLALSIRALFAFPLLLFISILLNSANSILQYMELNLLLAILGSVICLIIAEGIFSLGLKKYPVNVILPISSVYPVFTAFILIITGLEAISTSIIIGTIIVVMGVILVTVSSIQQEI